MDTAAEVLLIVVSSVLSIFLIVGIVALVYVVKILKQIKLITDRAENVAESMESAPDTFKKTATPIAILKLVGNIVDQASRVRKKKG